MEILILLAVIMTFTDFETFTQKANVLNHKKTAIMHFVNDSQWYQDNIPFFECSDKDLENVYYFRWYLFMTHFRNLGKDGYIVTKFLNVIK